MVTDHCAVPRCRADVEIVYLGHGVCMNHWNRFTADDAPPDKLRMVLGIEADATNAREDTMSETTPAATQAATEETMTEKKSESKVAKKARAAKAATKAKTPKEPKPKREKAPKEPKPGRVFAFRLTDDELAAIHRTAGPRNATRFIRVVAAAFANGDEAAFRTVLKEAKEARG